LGTFDNTQVYSWPILTASGGISGFNSANVTIDASQFANALGSGTFSVTVSGNTMYLNFGIAAAVTCPGNISDNNAAGQCGQTESFAATVIGNPAPTVTYTIPGPTTITSPYFFPVGTTVVTCTASNVIGSQSCTFTVTVTDTTPPVPATFSLGAVAGTTNSIAADPSSKLLLLASTPIIGGTLSITSVNPLSALGGLVTLSGGVLSYAAPSSASPYSDTITYTLSDGCGTATGTIAVSVSPNGPGNNGLTITPLGGGCILLQFFGIPGQSYYIQQTSSLNPPVTWTDLVQTNANSIGVVSYINCTPTSPSFYRTSATP
jgi:hypothetical protein